jgi:hypothetical protein
MDHEQHDPRGADAASDEEPAVDHPTAGEGEEADENPAEVSSAVECTSTRFDFAGLRAMPVVPPGLFQLVHKQEDWAAAMRSSALRAPWRPAVSSGVFELVRRQQEGWAAAMHSSVLRAAWRPAVQPGVFQVIRKHQEEWAAAMRSSVLRAAWRPAVPPGVFEVLHKHQEEWAKRLRGFAAVFEEQLRAGAPPNWQFADDWPRLTKITETVVQDGIPLAWVPRANIVVALVHTEDIEARRVVLANHEADIIQDCFTCLDDIDVPELAEFVANAREAARAFQDQYAKPAQAFATVVLDALLRLLFATPSFSYGEIRHRLDGVWDNTPLRYMRSALVLAAIPGALEQFWPHRGDPVPVRFNRHASAHTLHAGQFTRTNALVAIMTITSLLREAQESVWYVHSDIQQSAS